MPFGDKSDTSGSALGWVVYGAALGVVVECLAVFAAMLSGGAGHGDYVAARLLFPVPMLLTLVEGEIGTLVMFVGLVQFPVYGGLLGWAHARNRYLPVLAAGALHGVATIGCFAGLLPYFS